MRVALPVRIAVLAIALGLVPAAALAASSAHPVTGLYKATPKTGKPFSFHIVKAICPPPVRGGNQHQKLGYCYKPVGDPTFDITCKSGATIDGESYALFDGLLTSAGKLSEPETSSDGTTGAFHITVGTNGHASGFYEVVFHRSGGGSVEKCPTGRITFTAQKVS